MPPRKYKKKLSKRQMKAKFRADKAGKQSESFEKSLNNPPRSMIFRRGVVGDHVRTLVRDLRCVMAPFSATKLRENKRNRMSDFIQAASPFGVTHFMILSQTATGVGLRVARLPRGPTLTFRVANYTTISSIQSAQKVPHALNGPEFSSSPLVVLNNFVGDADHIKIMGAVFQNMFPGLDISTLKLSQCRRVVLFNYNTETDTVDFRHYVITAVPVGVTTGVRKIIKGKIPDRLASRDDIADWVENPAGMSDSEAELPADARVTLAQDFSGRGNAATSTSAIKLKEVGPRMTLQLYKVEDGVCDGQVVFHRYVTKTEEEAVALQERKERERREKAERRALQEANILRKQQEQEEKLKAREERRAARKAAMAATLGANAGAVAAESDSEDDDDEDEPESQDGGHYEGEDLEDLNIDDELSHTDNSDDGEEEEEGEEEDGDDDDDEEEEEEEESEESEEESEEEVVPPPAKRPAGAKAGVKAGGKPRK